MVFTNGLEVDWRSCDGGKTPQSQNCLAFISLTDVVLGQLNLEVIIVSYLSALAGRFYTAVSKFSTVHLIFLFCTQQMPTWTSCKGTAMLQSFWFGYFRFCASQLTEVMLCRLERILETRSMPMRTPRNSLITRDWVKHWPGLRPMNLCPPQLRWGSLTLKPLEHVDPVYKVPF